MICTVAFQPREPELLGWGMMCQWGMRVKCHPNKRSLQPLRWNLLQLNLIAEGTAYREKPGQTSGSATPGVQLAEINWKGEEEDARVLA